ncbi:MAG: ribosomal RNA small subunit methyltransferase H [Gemmatimonadota bacterium]|nr:MAG: ribosomal RNA small subunit methyltransferase H [Gemmatimonadota bacterium]
MRLHHVPVLRDRAVEYWATAGARRLVDGTVGRAGHSLALLGERPEVELLAIDRDPEAVAFVERRFAGFGSRARVIRGSYGALADHLAGWGGAVDGILLDLGVSSPQLDDAARGFSTRHDAPLDLRFDPTQGESARDWLARVELRDLVRVLRDFGEEPHATAVARAILAARERGELETTGQLMDAVRHAAGRRQDKTAKAGARVFQAIRIHVNDELGELDRFLADLRGLLAPGGRVVVISFHSLEDRRVKQAFREASRDCVCPPEFPACVCGGRSAWLDVLTRRPLTATPEEVAANPRARSAKLRVAERRTETVT